MSANFDKLLQLTVLLDSPGYIHGSNISKFKTSVSFDGIFLKPALFAFFEALFPPEFLRDVSGYLYLHVLTKRQLFPYSLVFSHISVCKVQFWMRHKAVADSLLVAKKKNSKITSSFNSLNNQAEMTHKSSYVR